ncbi:AMP-binding protein [Novosphingobium resinovorum]
MQVTEMEWPVQTASRLRRLTNSGGALTVDLVRRLRALFPQARLFPMYGLTEAFRSTYLDPDLVDTHPTSMGMAIPHAEILVINDLNTVSQDGEEGNWSIADHWWRKDTGRIRRAPPNATDRRLPPRDMAGSPSGLGTA